jgi:hypothetical protein
VLYAGYFSAPRRSLGATDERTTPTPASMIDPDCRGEGRCRSGLPGRCSAPRTARLRFYFKTKLRSVTALAETVQQTVVWAAILALLRIFFQRLYYNRNVPICVSLTLLVPAAGRCILA